MRAILVALLTCLAISPSAADKGAMALVHPKPEPIPKPVLSLVTAWLNAQNEGSFAAYSALYAPEFKGVRRSGDRTVNFDRDGWLKDRERMFKKKMRVSLSMLRALTGQTPARIELRFTQFFKSGTYEDAGPKRMVFVAVADGWRVAEEEMISSTIQRPLAGLLKIYGQLVVLADKAPEAWAEGAPSDTPGWDYDRAATRDVAATAQVPEKLRALVGARVKLYSRDASVCTAKIGTLKILYRGGASDTVNRRREGDLLRDGARSLVATLEDQKDCFGDQAMAELDPPARPISVRVTKPRANEAALRKAWAAAMGAPAPTGVSVEQCMLNWTEFELKEAGKPVTLLFTVDSCKKTWALFEGAAELKLRKKGEGGLPYPPSLAADLDADGSLEFLFFPQSWGYGGAEPQKLMRLEPAPPSVEDLPIRLQDAPSIFHADVGC